jgi:DNA-binding MarR family transcriptional regulator
VFSRSSLHQQLAARTEHGAELSHIFVVQAVEPRPGETEPEVTVGVVAERLGVDPSTASRLVAESLRAGYLARTASPADGRRARLALTDAGRTLVADARRYQRSVFERATRDWSERERQEFARLFVEFADAVAAAVAEARDRQR